MVSSTESNDSVQVTVTGSLNGPANSVATALNAAATTSQPFSTTKTSVTLRNGRSLQVTRSLLDTSCGGSRFAAQPAITLFMAAAWPAHDPIGSDSTRNPVAINASSHSTRPLKSVVVGVVVGVEVTVVVVVVIEVVVVVWDVVVEV